MLTKIQIDKLDNKGRGITYINNKIAFINNALPSEIPILNNIKEYKKYIEANAINISNNNLNRIIPKCPYYNSCGGCHLMHMSYPYQLDFKLNKVKDILYKYAGIDYNIKLIESNKDLFYRNKIELKIENNKWGYYNYNSHKLIEINNCLLASNAINSFLINKPINIKSGEIIIRSNKDEELLIIINSNSKITYNILPSNIKGIILNDKLIYGSSYFYDYIDNYKFKISYNSFFQINNYIANEIFNLLKNNIKGDTLLDLYCGIGTLGLSVKDNFKNIIGIEKISNAIKDAKENALTNGVNNAKYYVGDTGDVLNKLNIKPDTIIIDPPRSGLNKTTLDDILKINPKTIAYISCDPMTLARDLSVLKNNYKIKRINILDMFPNTYHCEIALILKLKSISI